MARVWIRGGGSPVFRVSKPGYDAADGGLADQYLSFDAQRVGQGTLYLAGHVAEATVAANGGTIVSFPDFGYVPVTRVLVRSSFASGRIANVTAAGGIATNSTEVYRLFPAGTDYYYFVYTQRVG